MYGAPKRLNHGFRVEGFFQDRFAHSGEVMRFRRVPVRRQSDDWNRDMAVSETWGRGFFPGFHAEGRKDRSDPLYALLTKSTQ